jgi:hypothetical protein
MITITAIYTGSEFEPESIPNTTFGSHFDGVNYYFFENDEERIKFYENL